MGAVAMQIELAPNRGTWLKSLALLVLLTLYFAWGIIGAQRVGGRVFYASVIALNVVLIINNARKWIATREKRPRIASWDGETLTLPSVTGADARFARGDLTECVIAAVRTSLTIAVRAKDGRTCVLTSSDWESAGLVQLGVALREAGIVTKES